MLVLIGLLAIIVFIIVATTQSKNLPFGPPNPKNEVSQPGLPRRFVKGLRGTVRDLEKREVSSRGSKSAGPEDYLSFRLERVDDVGDVIEFIPVELRAEEIPGRIIKAGDPVIVTGRRNKRGLLVPKAIFNLNTKSEITISSAGFGDAVLKVVFGLFWMAIGMAFFVGLLLSVGEPEIGISLIAASAAGMIICIYVGKKRRW